MVPQPLYSPELSPCVPYLFPELKTMPIEDLLSKEEQRIYRCVAAQRKYFEQNNNDVCKKYLISLLLCHTSYNDDVVDMSSVKPDEL